MWICAWHGNDITVVSDLNEQQIKEKHGERPDELLNFSIKNIVFLRVTWGLNQYSLQFITYKKNQMLCTFRLKKSAVLSNAGVKFSW